MQLPIVSDLEIVLEQPALFYYLVFTLTFLLTVSLARLAEAKGCSLPNLAARKILPRFFVIILLLILWGSLTFIIFRTSQYLIMLAIFGASLEILLYALLIISIYLGLTVLFNKWHQGGTASAGIFAVIIGTFFLYAMSFKPGWVCKPMAISGLSFTYGCVARAYEYPGDKGLKADGKQMRYWYGRAAQAGDSEAAYLVALRSVDASKKYKLFEQAATDGHAKSAYQYSLLQRDQDDSIKWLRIAADENVPDAMYELGIRYRDGRGVKKDLNHTRQLWLQAAEVGSILAMVQLSSSYQSNSVLFDKDIERHGYWKQKTLNEKKRRMAKKINHLISMQEDPFNAYVSTQVKYMIEHIDDQEKHLTQTIENDPDYLKKKAKLYLQYQDGDALLRGKAVVIYTKLAKAGDIDSQFELATLLLNSKQADSGKLEEGRHWLMASANAGHERAALKIIDAYEKGESGFPKDLVKALYYSEKRQVELAKRSNSSVNRRTQQFAYFRSQNIEADMKKNERFKTIKMLRGPAQEGDANAQYRLAHLLMVEHKRIESFSWLEKAAKNGNPDAQFLQSKRIAFKKPRGKFAKLSFTYLKEAAEKNHPGAIISLAENYYSGYKIISLKRNMYQAYLLFNKVLNSTNGDIIFVNKFGNPKMPPSITRDYVVAKLNKIPEAIKRLKLRDLTKAQKNSYVEQWYLNEINNLDRKENSQDYLDIINDQRDALLSPIQNNKGTQE